MGILRPSQILTKTVPGNAAQGTGRIQDRMSNKGKMEKERKKVLK